MTIGGDWNICHRREDLKNWKANQKKSGFLADERAFMDAVFGTFPDEESQVADHGDFLGAVDYVGTKGRRQAAVSYRVAVSYSVAARAARARSRRDNGSVVDTSTPGDGRNW